jgi:hypothetical protein
VTHLPYIVAAYALGVLVPAAFAWSAYVRMRGARRRLAAVDTRRRAAVDPRLRAR